MTDPNLAPAGSKLREITEVPDRLVQELRKQLAHGLRQDTPRLRDLAEKEARRYAERIWFEAFIAGASYGITIAQKTKYVLVTPEEKERIVANLRNAGQEQQG